jgi:hypothetical protein
MKSFNFQNGFEATFPDEWNVEKSDDLVSIYNASNGVGALQISSYIVPDPNIVKLDEELKGYLEQKYGEVNLKLLNKYAWFSVIDDGNRYWHYWLLNKANILMFITYNCKSSDKSIEKGVVDRIIKSML